MTPVGIAIQEGGYSSGSSPTTQPYRIVLDVPTTITSDDLYLEFTVGGSQPLPAPDLGRLLIILANASLIITSAATVTDWDGTQKPSTSLPAAGGVRLVGNGVVWRRSP